MALEYMWVDEVDVRADVKEVNELLRGGWRLLDYVKECGAPVAFIVARGSWKGPWRKNQDGSEWAPASDVPGIAERARKGTLVEGGYKYWISRSGKYVQRRPLEGGPPVTERA